MISSRFLFDLLVSSFFQVSTILERRLRFETLVSSFAANGNKFRFFIPGREMIRFEDLEDRVLNSRKLLRKHRNRARLKIITRDERRVKS